MPRAAARSPCHAGTFFPCWRAVAFVTLWPSMSIEGSAPLFIFQRPLAAPLLVLAALAALVILDSLVDLSALL